MYGNLDEVPVSFKLFIRYLALLDLEPLVRLQVNVFVLVPVVEVRVVVIFIFILFAVSWLLDIVLSVAFFEQRFGTFLTSKFVAVSVFDVDEDLLFIYFAFVLQLCVFYP